MKLKITIKNGSFFDNAIVFSYNILLNIAYFLFKNDPDKLEQELKELIKDCYNLILKGEV